MRRTGIVLFFIIIICIPAYAQVASPIHEQVGKYEIAPNDLSQDQTAQNLTYAGGATDSLSFWGLPLWIQVACAVQALIGLFIIIKITPIVLGKLSTLYKNKRANRVMEYVNTNPGSTMTEISRKTNIKRDTVKYYVYEFISLNKIMLEKFGRQSLLFKFPLKYNVFEMKVISYLHDDASRKTLYAILENPGIMNAGLAKRFELSEGTTHWHIERLLKDKIITYDRQGNSKKYFIDVNAEKIIRKYYDKSKDNE